MNKKALFIVISVTVVVIAVISIVLNNKRNDNIATKPLPTLSPTVLATIKATVKVEEKGEILGKLCYPSSFIPKGTIQFKNIDTNEILEKNYGGTEEEKTSNFSQSLNTGKYIIRFKPGLEGQAYYGYSTDVCSTGLETSCAQNTERKNNVFEIKAGSKTEGVNICDFYYSKDTEPKF